MTAYIDISIHIITYMHISLCLHMHVLHLEHKPEVSADDVCHMSLQGEAGAWDKGSTWAVRHVAVVMFATGQKSQNSHPTTWWGGVGWGGWGSTPSKKPSA